MEIPSGQKNSKCVASILNAKRQGSNVKEKKIAQFLRSLNSSTIATLSQFQVRFDSVGYVDSTLLIKDSGSVKLLFELYIEVNKRLSSSFNMKPSGRIFHSNGIRKVTYLILDNLKGYSGLRLKKIFG